jgi:hypothetical protein
LTPEQREKERLRKAVYRAKAKGQPPVPAPVPFVPPAPEHPAKNKRSPERYQAILQSLEVGNTRRAAAAYKVSPRHRMYTF